MYVMIGVHVSLCASLWRQDLVVLYLKCQCVLYRRGYLCD